jgi:hypothetical protein
MTLRATLALSITALQRVARLAPPPVGDFDFIITQDNLFITTQDEKLIVRQKGS